MLQKDWTQDKNKKSKEAAKEKETIARSGHHPKARLG